MSSISARPDAHDIIAKIASEALDHLGPWIEAVRDRQKRPGIHIGWETASCKLSNGQTVQSGWPHLQVKWSVLHIVSSTSAFDRMCWERVLSKVYFDTMIHFEDQCSNVTRRGFARVATELLLGPVDIDMPGEDHANGLALANTATPFELGTRSGTRPEIFLRQGLEPTNYISSAGVEVDMNDVLHTIRTWSRQPPFSLDEDPIKLNELNWRIYVKTVAAVALEAYRLGSLLRPVVTTMSMLPDNGLDWDTHNEDLTIYATLPLSS